MNNRKLLSVTLTILLAVALVALAAPAVAADDPGDAGVTAEGEVSTDDVSTDQPEIDIAIEPANLQSAPGDTNTYEVVVYNATEGIQGYDSLDVVIEDDSVAQFTDFVETANNNEGAQAPFSNTEIRDGGSVFHMEAALADKTFDGDDRIVIAEVDVEATGEVFDESAVTIDEAASPTVQNLDGEAYPVGELQDSQYSISFDMSLDFNDQEVGAGATVTVDNVDSDGEDAAVVVTYENDAGDLVVAGLATGQWDDEAATVAIQDTGGFSENAEGDLEGEHTAHIIPVSGLSGEYAPGDVVSAETAGNVIDQDTATVTDPAIPDLVGLDIVITEGLTIGDDYPLNQRDMIGAVGSIYGDSGLPLPSDAEAEDSRFAPIASGQHVGLSGLPIQDEVYQWLNVSDAYETTNGDVSDGTLLDFQTDAPTQTVAVSFNGVIDEGDQKTVTLDYGEAHAHGLQISEVSSVEWENIDNFDPADDVEVDAVNGQVHITVTESQLTAGDSPTVQFELVWGAVNPVEGLNVDAADNIDYETDHRVIAPDGDQERDNFVTFEVGATGISHADTDNANNGFLNQSTEDVDLVVDEEVGGAASGTANDGAFLVWQGQTVTFETATPGDTIDLWQVDTVQRGADNQEFYQRGAKVPDDVVGFDDTAPGQVANLDTSSLSEGQYFVTFGPDQNNAVVLDVHPLNLDASAPDSIANENQTDPFEIDVTSDDTSGGNVEAWFHHEGQAVSDVVHVERDVLTGAGDRTMEIIPAVDLVGPGNYTATILHTESGVTTQVEFVVEEEDLPDLKPAEDVNIVSPSLLDPEEPGIFDRGDIIPIELELIDGNVATVTFGDQVDQNVELHATVYDPTWSRGDGDTTVKAYLNTYQIGHGLVENDTGALVPNRPSWIAPGDWEDRQHGFFTDPSDATSGILGDVYATQGIDIFGGSQGGAVVSPGDISDGPEGEYPGFRYDLHAIGDFIPHTETEDERDDVNALDVEQRSTDDFTLWTAPGEGENALDFSEVTTTEDIEALVEEGLITEVEVEEQTYVDDNGEEQTRLVYDGSIAEGDYLIVQAESSGLEGIMHETVVRNQGLAAYDVADLLAVMEQRASNHFVTSEFQQSLLEPVPRLTAEQTTHDRLIHYNFNVFENESAYQARIAEADENAELVIPNRVNPDMGVGSVIAGTNEEGNLYDYFMPYEFQPSEIPGLVSADEALTRSGQMGDSLIFDTEYYLEPSGGEQQNVQTTYTGDDPNVPRSVNPLLRTNSAGLEAVDELPYLRPQVNIDDIHMVGGQLEVPGQAEWTVTGTSTMAPGTTLDISMLSLTGEGTPFFQEFLSVETVAQPGDAPATWEVTADFAVTRDGVEIQAGTDFETDIDRAGSGAGVFGGEDIPGVVLDDPAVGTFTFDDQRGDGDVVTIDAYQANRISSIFIEDANGDVLASIHDLDRSLHEQFNIELDEQVTENQDLTAVAIIDKPEQDTVLAERTAFYNVEDQTEAFFSVSDLDPQTATVEEGDEVEVSATVENIGDLEGTQDVTLEVDGISDSQSLTLAGGESDTVTFTVEAPSAGDYTHTVSTDNDETAGALTVEEPPEPASFQVVSISPQEATATQGDSVTVQATIQNTGDMEGTQDVTLDIDGVTQTESLTLAGGETGSVSFDVDTSDVDPGDYTHTISTSDDDTSGSLTIENASDDSDTDSDTGDDDADDDGAGFGVVVAALALLGAALLAMRRQVE